MNIQQFEQWMYSETELDARNALIEIMAKSEHDNKVRVTKTEVFEGNKYMCEITMESFDGVMLTTTHRRFQKQ